MLNALLSKDIKEPQAQPGDLYKEIEIFGKTFHIYYGYYDECEQDNPLVDPMPIYPDFLKDPQHTEEGYAFVTKMQDACKHYDGKPSEYKECAECAYYHHGEELLGICTYPERSKEETT